MDTEPHAAPTSAAPSRPPARVLLVCRDAARSRQLASAARAAVDDVVIAHDLDAPVAPAAYDAIVVDDEALPERPTSLLQAWPAPRPPVVVLLHTASASRLLPWIEHAEAVHAIQYDSVQRFGDLHVTLRKLTSGDIFGVRKYVGWAPRERLHTLRSTHERDALFASLEDFTAQLGLHERIGALAAVALDEFVSNAFYNAPVDASGAHRYRSQSRRLPVTLAEHEAIAVSFCADGRRLGLSVVDPFGSLRLESLRMTMARGLRKGIHVWDSDEGGAGLGFYCAFESLSHLIVNVEPGRRTELIGIFSLRDSYREFLSSGRSFNMFEVAPASAQRGVSP